MRFLSALILLSLSLLNAESYFNYRVVRFDTVESIALQFKVDTEYIRDHNRLNGKKYLLVGQELEIPVSYTYQTPIDANLTFIMNNSTTRWRNPLFEVYKWDKGTNVLIFDTYNYSFQSLMFKRLAFFVEKKDYIGQIYSLSELEGERGWNGHDYSAKDLARFFNKVNFEGHSITKGEEILLDFLLRNDILTLTKQGYRAGEGAVLSCSRGSFYNHRRTILRHEAFHGLFFTSLEFRKFTRQVWNGMDYQSRNIWRMYMEVLEYNNNDIDLVMNEFMAYMLQGSEDETYYYLNEIVWYRLWDYFPEKRQQINRFFESSKTPYQRQIRAFKEYVTKLQIE